jgi:hypothetical protein
METFLLGAKKIKFNNRIFNPPFKAFTKFGVLPPVDAVENELPHRPLVLAKII